MELDDRRNAVMEYHMSAERSGLTVCMVIANLSVPPLSLPVVGRETPVQDAARIGVSAFVRDSDHQYLHRRVQPVLRFSKELSAIQVA